jgi:hypothetical protein
MGVDTTSSSWHTSVTEPRFPIPTTFNQEGPDHIGMQRIQRPGEDSCPNRGALFTGCRQERRLSKNPATSFDWR